MAVGYFHDLHHKHFECNNGGSLVPLDGLAHKFTAKLNLDFCSTSKRGKSVDLYQGEAKLLPSLGLDIPKPG